MAKAKSIVEKFTDTMKGLADSASQALKAEEPPRVDETAAAYLPFAAEGMVSDPTLPIAVQPVRKRRAANKAAGRRAGKSSSKSAAKTSARKAAGKKAARRPARTRAKAAVGKSARTTKTMKRGGRKARKKSR